MSARRIIPLLDRVLVERVLPQTKSAGGILLPDSAVSKVCPCARANPVNREGESSIALVVLSCFPPGH